jgi:hypothetical protein
MKFGSTMRKPSVIDNKQRKLRQTLWPEVRDADLWDSSNRKGYKTIPRTMPYLQQFMDNLSKGKPLSDTYLELWCRAFDHFLIVLNKPQEMAFASGFKKARAVHMWHERLDILARLGFIKLKDGAGGKYGYALVMDPFPVVKSLYAKHQDQITSALYNAFVERAIDTGSDDLD